MMDCAIDYISRDIRPWANRSLRWMSESVETDGGSGRHGRSGQKIVLGVRCLRKKQLVWKHGNIARRCLLPALETG